MSRRTFEWLVTGAVSFLLAAVAACVLVVLVVLTAVPFVVSFFPWPLRITFGIVNTVLPVGGGALVLVSSARRISVWRRTSAWPAIAVAGVLTGIAIWEFWGAIDDANCFFFGVSLTGLGAEDCDVGVR